MCNTTPHGGDTQRAELALTLGDKDPLEWDRLIGTGLQLSHQGGEVFLEVNLKQLDRLLIDACRTAVTLDRLEGFEHHLGRDPTRQRVVSILLVDDI